MRHERTHAQLQGLGARTSEGLLCLGVIATSQDRCTDKLGPGGGAAEIVIAGQLQKPLTPPGSLIDLIRKQESVRDPVDGRRVARLTAKGGDRLLQQRNGCLPTSR